MELPRSDWSCSWSALFSKTCRYEDIGLLRYFYLIIWATSWENLFLPYANNKDADQPAHPRSLINVFVIRCLDSLIRLVSMSEISGLLLVSGRKPRRQVFSCWGSYNNLLNLVSAQVTAWRALLSVADRLTGIAFILYFSFTLCQYDFCDCFRQRALFTYSKQLSCDLASFTH